MTRRTTSLAAALSCGAMLMSVGCASSPTTPAEDQLAAAERELATLRNQVNSRERDLARSQSTVTQLETKLKDSSAAASRTSGMSSDGGLLPPAAKAGECYAKALVPPTYRTETQQMIQREASTRMETIPARYEKATERVLVKEASSQLVAVPATYETVTERVQTQGPRTLWRLGQTSKAAEADSSLINEASKLGLDLASARPGTCYDERVIPARYETRSEQMLSSEASARVEIIPAKYEMAEERVLVREAGTRIVEVPAVYKTETERILVSPATTEWKKGTGAIQRIDHTTGEIMCLVEIPAKYKTVSKRMLVSPATTKTVEIPAEYSVMKVRRMVSPPQERRVDIPAKFQTVTKREQVSDAGRLWVPAGKTGAAGASSKRTGRQLCMAEAPARYETVTRRVVKTPATTKRVEIPAEYRTVTVNKLVKPASSRTIEIPAEYATVTKQVKVTEATAAWRPVLCETNASRSVVSKIQQALKTAGHDPGPIDGVIGRQTLAAVTAYQTKKGLPTGGLTYRTLDSLGVKLGNL